jgi:hypothetical protein
MNNAVKKMTSASNNMNKIVKGLKNHTVSKYINAKGLPSPAAGGKRRTIRRRARHSRKN